MRERIELWKRIFETDDNAISNQISKLAWDLAAFTCLVEIVRQAPETSHGKRLNGMMMDMLVSGFWSTTMQGVRKLAERGTIHGAQGVCSLGGLLEDVRATRLRLTRQIFVEEISGADYNYRVTEDRYWQWAMGGQPNHARWTPRELHYEISQQRHETFDRLSGSAPGASNPRDIIREEVFADLNGRLSALDAVVEHVNVEVAHAATEASREGRMLEQWNLVDAKSAIKELAQIAEQVGSWFCFSGIGSVLPTPQFDQFEHLEQPLFNGDISDLQRIWDEINREMGQWHDVNAED